MYGKVNVGGGSSKKIFQLNEIEPVYENVELSATNEKIKDIVITSGYKTFTLFDDNYCFVFEYLMATKQVKMTKLTIDLELITVKTSTETFTGFDSTASNMFVGTKQFVDCGAYFLFFCSNKAYKIDKTTCDVNYFKDLDAQLSNRSIWGVSLDNESNIILTTIYGGYVYIYRLNKDTLNIMNSISQGAGSADYISRAVIQGDGNFYFSYSKYQEDPEGGGYYTGSTYVINYTFSSIATFINSSYCVSGDMLVDVPSNSLYFVSRTGYLVKMLFSNTSSVVNTAPIYTINGSKIQSGIVNDSIFLSNAYGGIYPTTFFNQNNDIDNGRSLYHVYNIKEQKITSLLNAHRINLGDTSFSNHKDFHSENFYMSNNKNYMCMAVNSTNATNTLYKVNLVVKPFPKFETKAHTYGATIASMAQDEQYIAIRSNVGSKTNPRIYDAQTLEFIKTITSRDTTTAKISNFSYIGNGEVYYLWSSNEVEIYKISDGTNRAFTIPTQTIKGFLVKNGFVYIIGLINTTNKYTLNKYTSTGTLVYSVNIQDLYNLQYASSSSTTLHEFAVDNGIIYMINPNSGTSLVMLNDSDGSLNSIKTLSIRPTSGTISMTKTNNLILYCKKQDAPNSTLTLDIHVYCYDLINNINKELFIENLGNSYLTAKGVKSIKGYEGMICIHIVDKGVEKMLLGTVRKSANVTDGYEFSFSEQLPLIRDYDSLHGTMPNDFIGSLYSVDGTKLYKYYVQSVSKYSLFKGYKIKK